MVMGFAICSLAAIIFLLIGISTWKSKEPAGFFTFVKRPAVSDVKRYNHAVSVLWMAAAVILELTGVPILFLEQNSPFLIVIILAVVIMVLAMMIVYTRVEAKYSAPPKSRRENY